MQESFEIAAVFRRSLGVVARRAPVLLALGVLAQLPIIVYSASDQVDMSNPGDDIRMLGLVLSMLMLGAVSFATIVDLKGARARFVPSLRVALKQMYPILGVGLVLGLFPLILSYYPALLTALILPWIMITTLLYAAIPAAVAEQRGVRASLLRSVELTRGRRWRIFLILAFLGVAKMASTDLLDRLLGSDPDALTMLAHQTLDLVVEVYAAVIAGVTYFSLARSYPEA